MPPKYTGPNTPNTPGSVTGDFSVPSPQGGDMQRMARSGTPGDKSQKFPMPSPGGPRTPGINDGPRSPGMGGPRFNGPNMRGPSGMSPNPNMCQDTPLNPATPTSSGQHEMNRNFDPISSMAQMSQQLTNSSSVPCSTPNCGDPRHMRPGFSPGPMGLCGPGDSRMMGPHGDGGGATFATVKASAPNTIQYLPSRPQYSDTRPRGPPSLDFLHRFANPDKGSGPGGMQGGGPMGPDGLMSNGPNKWMGMMTSGPMGSPGSGPNPIMGMMGPRGGIMRGLRPPEIMQMMTSGPMGSPGSGPNPIMGMMGPRGGRMRGPPPPEIMQGGKRKNSFQDFETKFSKGGDVKLSPVQTTVVAGKTSNY
jgi:hypothetical protein